jgi:hypothetical protein
MMNCHTVLPIWLIYGVMRELILSTLLDFYQSLTKIIYGDQRKSSVHGDKFLTDLRNHLRQINIFLRQPTCVMGC